MRAASPTWCFAVVLVKRGQRFLLVHERKHQGGWYFPAGKLELGETFADAALRETREEAGVEIVLEGILKLQHTPPRAGADQRLRVFFLARQADDAPPKQVADEHSLEAAWFTLEELRQLTLRGDEVEAWVRHALDHPAELLPLTALTGEVP